MKYPHFSHKSLHFLPLSRVEQTGQYSIGSSPNEVSFSTGVRSGSGWSMIYP